MRSAASFPRSRVDRIGSDSPRFRRCSCFIDGPKPMPLSALRADFLIIFLPSMVLLPMNRDARSPTLAELSLIRPPSAPPSSHCVPGTELQRDIKSHLLCKLGDVEKSAPLGPTLRPGLT